MSDRSLDEVLADLDKQRRREVESRFVDASRRYSLCGLLI